MFIDATSSCGCCAGVDKILCTVTAGASNNENQDELLRERFNFMCQHSLQNVADEMHHLIGEKGFIEVIGTIFIMKDTTTRKDKWTKPPLLLYVHAAMIGFVTLEGHVLRKVE